MSPVQSVSLERLRAASVLGQVQSWDKERLRKTVQRAKGLAVEMRAQGLMVTFANLMGSKFDEERQLATLLSRWLLVDCPLNVLDSGSARGGATHSLLSACRSADRRAYRIAQGEALFWAQQFKLIAEALLATLESKSRTMDGPAERNLHRARCGFAFERLLKLSPEATRRLAGRLKGLPVEVQANGLLVALSDLLRETVQDSQPVREGRPGWQLADTLALWLMKASPRPVWPLPVETVLTPKALLAVCSRAPRAEYQAAQAEALALLSAMKIYAAALSADPEWALEEF